ncbi:hypothetical protein [Mycobacterium sp. 236(2023)]|uniref:hypothetical protein n=1 Tax=Mycobacterium sp. 236(2023) TaxID=3038163 RepID=UPI002414EDE3|nr:hypothetical protein [Mycobacterium sp. 236(2023)]MDG4665213.1 hypothetical protein [Mycobacterium sp. 236(2023)]
MLPSRSRLESWNPDSLTFAGKAIQDRGKAVADSVTALSTNIATMPETRAWSGIAHDAATQMFGRADKQTTAFSAYTTALGNALSAGAGKIGGARTALLDKADQIDMTGQLYVSDQWVVLITGAKMTLEEAAALEKRAQAEQATVNRLLLAVGAADDATADSLTAAAKPHGFEVPNSGAPTDPLSVPIAGSQRPGDEVPNPSNPVGMMQQATLRDADMSQTVRDSKTETTYDPATGEETSTTTTVYMQDGSRHERTVDARPNFPDRGPTTTNTHYSKDGKMITETSSTTFNDLGDHSLKNAHVDTIKMADGTVVTVIERANGSKSASILTPDGRTADVPHEFFSNPVMTGVDATITGLGAQAERGIPRLTDEALEHIKVGTKYGGPALGVAQSLWSVAVADSGFERCVAAAEGATSFTTGTLAGLATAEAGPWVAVPVAIVASEGGTALGNWIGNTFCPR